MLTKEGFASGEKDLCPRIEGVGGVGVLFSRGRPCSNLHDLLDQTMPGSKPGALRTLHGCRECELGSEGFGSMPERYE